MVKEELDFLREEWKTTERYAGSFFCGIVDDVPGAEFFGDLCDLMSTLFQILHYYFGTLDEALEFIETVEEFCDGVYTSDNSDNTHIFAKVDNHVLHLEAPKEYSDFRINYSNFIYILADYLGCSTDYIISGIKIMINQYIKKMKTDRHHQGLIILGDF